MNHVDQPIWPDRLAPAGVGGQEVVVSLVPFSDQFLGLLDSLLDHRVKGVHKGEQLPKFEEAFLVDLIPTIEGLLDILFLLRGQTVIDVDGFTHCISSFPARPPRRLQDWHSTFWRRVGVAVEGLVQDRKEQERPLGSGGGLGHLLQDEHVALLQVAGPVLEELPQFVHDQ